MIKADCNSSKFDGGLICGSIHFMLLLFMAISPAACGEGDDYQPNDGKANTGKSDIGEACDRSSDCKDDLLCIEDLCVAPDEDGDSADGDGTADGDPSNDGDFAPDGDTPPDGDQADGDVLQDGDLPDGDRPVDGDVYTDGDIYTDGDLDEDCLAGDRICRGNSYITCLEENAGWSEPQDCPPETFCSEGDCPDWICEPVVDFLCEPDGRIQWCNRRGSAYKAPESCPIGKFCKAWLPQGCGDDNLICEPNGTACDEEDAQIILQCNDTGTGWLNTTIDCPAGETGARCHEGQCLDLCDLAKLTASHVACEYWPVVLPNPQLNNVYKSGNESEYAVVIANNNEEYAAHVDIEYFGGEFTRSLSVAPGLDAIVKLPYYEVENTVKTKKAFRLTSTVPVSVYQFNPISSYFGGIEAYTADASLLLPTDALGTDYMVLNYGSFGMLDGGNENLDAFYTIVATVDDTVVDIVSTADTRALVSAEDGDADSDEDGDVMNIEAMAPGGTMQVSLNRGEVLQIVSDTTQIDIDTCYYGDQGYGYVYCLGPDTTGTRISAGEPVAVYAGNECQFVPHYRWACDHLEQQLFPTDRWSTRHIGAWLQSPLPTQPNVYKIVALEDDTIITTSPNVNSAGTSDFRSLGGRDCTGMLAQGESCLIETQDNFLLTSNPGHPILMGQFLVGQNYNGLLDGNTIGDPAFTLVPAVKQFRKEYIFYVPETYDTDWITLISTSDLIEITLDGEPLDLEFTSIGSGEHRAFKLNMSISDGTHKIIADMPFGLLVYGYDGYVSYAYPAGLDL